ncbi:MAG: hypothetical protein KHW87_05470 [Clostridiales bacterium]|nr:hypothetical protein [Clostridiales bacterium]
MIADRLFQLQYDMTQPRCGGTEFFMNFIPSMAQKENEWNGNYFCTWCSQGGAAGMNEENMFGEKGLISSYPDDGHKSELIVVYDDGWDIAPDTRNPEEIYRYGVGYPNPDRFPSTRGMTPPQALRWLVDQTTRYGFAGAGLWMPMQTYRETDVMYDMDDFIAHYTKLAQWSQQAGIRYWKMDWGQHYWNNAEARENVTKIARKYAPDLLVEHAHVCGSAAPEPNMETEEERAARLRHVCRVMNVSDFYRTYDCGGITLIPTTVSRLSALLTIAPNLDENNGCRHIINVEDEVYIAAAMGATAGIMRNPVNGGATWNEVKRMLNWQRIMPPFALKNDGNHVDDEWMRNEFITQDHAVIKQSAPCRLSRNMPLADLSLKIGQYQPWILCATHPNGAVGVYSTRRTVPDWENCWAYADITISVKTVDSPVGIFGESYDTLTLVYPQDVTQKHVWVQDLADDTAYDVTDQVQRTKNSITLTRDQFPAFGLRVKAENDACMPGFMLQLLDD